MTYVLYYYIDEIYKRNVKNELKTKYVREN